MEELKCSECGTEFTAISEVETRPDDRNYVVEQKTCDTIDGKYTEWWQIVCPECMEVVSEWGR